MVKCIGSEIQQIEVLPLLIYDLVKLTPPCFCHLLSGHDNSIFPQL